MANLSVHLERDVLEQVLDVQFDAQPAADLAVKLLHQRITMSIQQPHQGRAVAGLGQDEQQLRVGVPVECDAGLHDLSSNRRSQIAPRRNGFFSNIVRTLNGSRDFRRQPEFDGFPTRRPGAEQISIGAAQRGANRYL